MAANFSLTMKAGRSAVVEIYDEIGPAEFGMIDAATVSRAISGVGSIDTIDVRINSPGGNVFEGIAIHNILKSHPAKVAVRVDGVAASSASLIAMCGDTIQVPRNALVMIHDPYCRAEGTRADLLKAIAMLDTAHASIVSTYAGRTGKSAAVIRAWMASETWMNGDEAVRNGFATTIGPELSVKASAIAPASLLANYNRTPAEAAGLFSLAMRSGSTAPAAPADERAAEARYRAEYAGNAGFAKAGMSLADYIASRRIDDGIDTLVQGWR